MKFSHRIETLALHAATMGFRPLTWRTAVAVGTGLGALLAASGLRAEVARANLARAFPERTDEERRAILAAHYRELGRVAAEYTQMPRWVGSPPGVVVAAVGPVEHLDHAHAAGRGVILLSGHFGNFELLAAFLGRRHAVDFLVQPLSNPGAEAWIAGLRRESGVGVLSTHGGVKRVYQSLRAGRWIAMNADQDARKRGVFVPFLGALASTPVGPARLSLATRAPIVFGAAVRDADGRHRLILDPPLWPEGDPRDPEAVRALTARHVALLEARVRAHPQAWFWLHRRWKTPPPTGGA